ncbi:ABC transporter substrate-binding protein [Candidatus Bipolaricaulota bacterium]|nr:ABC transporter substrate-binding protein [Candidatus Bipolaricaulota bacterium]
MKLSVVGEVCLVLLVSVLSVSPALANGPDNPVYGGSLSIALPAELPGLDPTTNTAAVIDRVMYNNVYQGLVRVNRNGEVGPCLAKSWEVSEDGRTYTFYLREGVTFHNGDPFTSSDVVYSLDRVRDDDLPVPHPEYYRVIKSVSPSGPHAVDVRLREASSIFLFNLARGDSVILSEDVKDPSSDPVGTGPFRFFAWQEGQSVKLVRFEDYYEDGLPYLEAVTFEFIADVNTQITALRSGDIDAIAYLNSPENALTLKSDPDLKVLEGVTTWEVILAMNNSVEPMDDLLVRQAVNYGINRSEVIEGVTFGFGEPIGSLMSPTNPNYLDLSWVYPYDPERSRQLLAEAGFPDGFSATLTLPSNYTLSARSGEIIAEQLQEVGIDLRVQKIGWGQWLQKVFSNAEYEMTIIGHAEAFDISIYANPDYYFKYDNKRFAEIIERAESEVDRTKRRGLYAIAQWILAEDVPSAFLFSAPSLPALSKSVHNWWSDYPIPVVDVTRVWKEG